MNTIDGKTSYEEASLILLKEVTKVVREANIFINTPYPADSSQRIYVIFETSEMTDDFEFTSNESLAGDLKGLVFDNFCRYEPKVDLPRYEDAKTWQEVLDMYDDSKSDPKRDLHDYMEQTSLPLSAIVAEPLYLNALVYDLERKAISYEELYNKLNSLANYLQSLENLN